MIFSKSYKSEFDLAFRNKRVSNFSIGTWEGGGMVSSFPTDIIYLQYNSVGVSLTEVRFQVPPKAKSFRAALES